MDFVYDNLVPSSCKAGLRNAGVMGGMSIAVKAFIPFVLLDSSDLRINVS